MKLNLLPATVSKGKKSRSALVLSVLIALAGAGIAVGLGVVSQGRLAAAKPLEADARARAQQAVDTSAYADEVVAQAAGIIKNTNLANSMLAHSDVYPAFYSRVMPFVPSFYRLTSMAVTPVDKSTVQLTFTGTLKTYQQYADLMIGLMRIPGAQSIGRSGFQSFDMTVPAVTEEDQVGRPRGPSDTAPIPDDPLARLAYYQGRTRPGGFTGEGNFGSIGVTDRGAKPEESLVTTVLTINLAPSEAGKPAPYPELENPLVKGEYTIQTPDPRATLASGGGAPAPAAAPAAGPPSAAGGDTRSKARGDD